jgi:hypothetical protein
MVPKLTFKLPAIDAVIPTTSGMFSARSFISRALAIAAAVVPTAPVFRQPCGAARNSRPATSAATMKAASISEGVARVISATGRIAGMTAAIDWPAK